jgi:hypothetical protein
MPLNKLENFIKNTEGRILYVNPNDLDATDSVENQGNSLTKPFRTVQRALLESARFSYLRGNDNDITEKTTILLFPGEHVIDNRPGYGIKSSAGIAKAISQSGTETIAQSEFSLTLDSNFDLTQGGNILYKFNSVYGGVVVPRGTSIVGLDLRKTKLRPKYVPNPTDSEVDNSAIFRITGACYFWQLSIFDGNESETVYTDPIDFSENNQSTPKFSHHKLTVFEYADGVNTPTGYDITDLDMYYAKLSNAFNLASGRDIDQKYPSQSGGFAKQRPEWEIVGAFQTDPINIASIISGDGATPGQIVSVTTTFAHGFSVGTPIKIRGVNVDDYNVSTKVASIDDNDPKKFTYLLSFVRDNLPAGSAAGLSGASATVTIETDTVGGASPYIFNCSLRSVWGMNGMWADGAKASGFRSMVVAQFTGVSLQKDDRAFVKYNETNRQYDGIDIIKATGSALASGSSSTNISTVYHLDSGAVYRQGWQPSHIKISNDSFIQVVSVFAIGYNKHFDVRSGGDASITNSNSNFGQFSLSSDGFKAQAFDKDNKGFITSIITPRASTPEEINIDYIAFDVNKTKTVGISSHLYLFGFNNSDVLPPVITQGFRIGSRYNEKVYVDFSNVSGYGVSTASVYMPSNIVGTASSVALGSDISEKSYIAIPPTEITDPTFTTLTTQDRFGNLLNHNIQTGEKIRIISDDGDIPENLIENTVYYAIRVDDNRLKIASSKTTAEASTPIAISFYKGIKLRVLSKVSDKSAGEIGSPIQWDQYNSAWFIHVSTDNNIYESINTLGVANLTERTQVAYIKRFDDPRSLDEKLYKMRLVIPKEVVNARDPIDSYVIQESSQTGARSDSDFTLGSITDQDYLYDRNPRFINTCSYDSISKIITITSEIPHKLNVEDIIVIKNVSSSDNATATLNKGYNGKFTIVSVTNDKTFTISSTDDLGIVHAPGQFTNNVTARTTSLPRFERVDLKSNLYIYRSETINQYIQNVQDGIYYLYVLNASNKVSEEFENLFYNQNIVDLYPQFDKDNFNDNPPSAVSFAKRNPIGDVVTNDLKKSITRETIDKFNKSFGVTPIISGVTSTTTSATLTFSREHGLSGLVTYTGSIVGGSGHTPGTYHNVKLYSDSILTNWKGATARVIVNTSGSVVSSDIITGGSAYANGETLYFDSTQIGGTPSGRINITTAGISTSDGNVIQVTGIGTTSDGYYRITSVPSTTTISIAKTAGDTTPVQGQYIFNIGPAVVVNTTQYSSVTGITTFTCTAAHGLVAGNRFQITTSSNNNLGSFVVDEKVGINTFTAVTGTLGGTPKYILKHGLSSNQATADNLGENLGTRGLSFYQNETFTLLSDITNDVSFPIDTTNSSGIGTTKRLPLGSYIQIDNEIMRVVSSTLSGSANNQITVIRGSLGTLKENHGATSLIRKIKPISIELRRPSVIRASGHTFEYLGYGPGNYSTGLPQIQNRTLTEREDFLAQSQSSSCGNSIFTGMNSNGDFFVGNTKYSATSGQQITFAIPIPTTTGQDPSRLSVVYDEVTVKERILVEGGNSGTVLSQFDGPVTFNKELKMNSPVIINDAFKVNATTEITDGTQSNSTITGAFILNGGAGIGKNVYIGGNQNVTGVVTFSNVLQSTSKDTGSLILNGGAGIEKNVYIGGLLNVTGVSTFVDSVYHQNDVRHQDNDSAFFGNSDDLEIVHDGSNSIIKDQGTGYLNLQASNSIHLTNVNNTENYAVLNENGSVDLYYDNTVRFQTTNTGVTVTGDMTATLDVIAFASDERLKTNIQPLENALDKVLTLSGFTYNFNEIGETLGFDTKITYVGVSAQQVQAVLPEAVKPAPVDSNYITVQYEKIVPLLIEAIKELKSEIDELKRSK